MPITRAIYNLKAGATNTPLLQAGKTMTEQGILPTLQPGQLAEHIHPITTHSSSEYG